ncbi:MAG TPA: tetratricopeptide repeat protein [Pyrinomonadaceae bacterium]|nr:tetratricopeptide repeat protein [Pyrinomonadaceae bacterium]
MNKKAIALTVIAVIASFAGGFLLANALNRKDLDALRAENAQLKNAQSQQRQQSDEFTLADEEIRKKIEEADRNTSDFDFQKNLAIGLYRYSQMKQDAKYLPDVARLLKRANEMNPQDYATIVALGNVYLDIGQINKDNAAIEQARGFYRQALSIKSTDADVQNDLGMSYFFAAPPETEKAIAEYEKALEINPRHEKAMENLIRANSSLGKTKEAEDFFNRLKQINSANEALPALEAQIAQSRNKQQ